MVKMDRNSDANPVLQIWRLRFCTIRTFACWNQSVLWLKTPKVHTLDEFICRKGDSIVTFEFSGVQPYKNGCFYMFEFSRETSECYMNDPPMCGFRVAKALCQDKGLVVAKILSQEENDVIKEMIMEVEGSNESTLAERLWISLKLTGNSFDWNLVLKRFAFRNSQWDFLRINW